MVQVFHELIIHLGQYWRMSCKMEKSSLSRPVFLGSANWWLSDLNWVHNKYITTDFFIYSNQMKVYTNHQEYCKVDSAILIINKRTLIVKDCSFSLLFSFFKLETLTNNQKHKTLNSNWFYIWVILQTPIIPRLFSHSFKWLLKLLLKILIQL